MKSNRKEKMFFVIVLVSLLLTSVQVDRIQGSTKTIAPTLINETGVLDNVTVELITNCTSHREDSIPSILPDGTVSARFNITNLSGTDLTDLEISATTNEYGVISPTNNSVKSTLAVEESWLTEEYIIELATNGTVVSDSLDLAIVLDQSGSMGDEIDALTTDLGNVITEISDQVSDIRIGLILFGGISANPYEHDKLIYNLTSDVDSIVTVLSDTPASGGYEPWGDALWVAQNRLEWREDAVKLMVLITDEPCDSGIIIGDGTTVDYDGPLLYDLFENLEAEGFILCTVAALGSATLVIKQLQSGATITGGTYIQLGGEGPQTSDLPDIIGELIIKYAVELDLKIDVSLSHLNASDIREYKNSTFVILIDDLPPDIETWVYFSEDFVTDNKIVNVLAEVKDVTGYPFVEIFYKFDSVSFWTVANASHVSEDTYMLSLEFSLLDNILYYQIYTKDWLGNEIITDVVEINLEDIDSYTTIETMKRKEITLIPYQQTVFKLVAEEHEPSHGIIFSGTDLEFDIIAADLNDSQVILDRDNCTLIHLNIKAGHTVKIALSSSVELGLHIINADLEKLLFNVSLEREILYDEAFLFELDNDREDEKERSFVADSEYVQTTILILDFVTWEILLKGSAEVILPSKKCYALVYTEYHYGEIFISFNYEDQYEPFNHYYDVESSGSNWIIVSLLLGLAGLGWLFKRKNR